jgi:DNA-binding XRE family transcriptional regulator
VSAAVALVPGVRAPACPMPDLIDFAAARAARAPSARIVDSFTAAPDDVRAAVREWRRSGGLRTADCAAAAGVNPQAWNRWEGGRAERSWVTWRILTWVMCCGGPAFDLSGPDVAPVEGGA